MLTVYRAMDGTIFSTLLQCQEYEAERMKAYQADDGKIFDTPEECEEYEGLNKTCLDIHFFDIEYNEIFIRDIIREDKRVSDIHFIYLGEGTTKNWSKIVSFFQMLKHKYQIGIIEFGSVPKEDGTIYFKDYYNGNVWINLKRTVETYQCYIDNIENTIKKRVDTYVCINERLGG